MSSERSETPPPIDGLIVGELVGPFGILGEVKLYPTTDFPERLPRYRRLVLALPDGSRQEVRVQRARPHKNIWVLKLRDINTPEQAEALRGAQAMVPAALAEPLPEGHFYLHDVIGLRVVTPGGEELGTVTDVLRSPANDVYVVGGSLLVPAVKEIVERIDPAAGVLVVRSMEALMTVEVSSDRSTEATDGAQQPAKPAARAERRSMKVRAGKPKAKGEQQTDAPPSASS